VLLLPSVLLATASASVAPVGDMPIFNPKNAQPRTCPVTSRYEASGRNTKPKARKLNELPDADVYRTVYRHIGQCEVPIIVKYGVAGR
jgi:hypothetical protein